MNKHSEYARKIAGALFLGGTIWAFVLLISILGLIPGIPGYGIWILWCMRWRIKETNHFANLTTWAVSILWNGYWMWNTFPRVSGFAFLWSTFAFSASIIALGFDFISMKEEIKDYRSTNSRTEPRKLGPVD